MQICWSWYLVTLLTAKEALHHKGDRKMVLELPCTVGPYAPVEVAAGSDEDHESTNTVDSDMYKS